MDSGLARGGTQGPPGADEIPQGPEVSIRVPLTPETREIVESGALWKALRALQDQPAKP